MKYTVKPKGKFWIVVNEKGGICNVPHKTRAEAEKHAELLNAFFG